jgi:undecaprenyl-diphosphatase
LGWLFYAYKKQTDNKIKLLHIFYATVLWIIISLIIPQFVNIERPETAIAGTGKLILDHIPDASFPSDHATVSFAFLAWLYLWGYRRLFYIYLPLCIIMNLSRVIAWVHWPYDIIAWAVVWISSAYIVFKYQGLIFLKKIDELILKISGFFKL